jgi:hypothetical protein
VLPAECIVVTQSHCRHCPKRGQITTAQVPYSYDYSHLIGDPAQQNEKKFDALKFEDLLTDYDRILHFAGVWNAHLDDPVVNHLLSIRELV